MLVTPSASLAVSTLFLSTTVLAAPIRTHCRCTFVSNAPSPALYTRSTAHWTPSDASPSPIEADKCFDLGPQLEDFQHTKPDLYDSYLRQSQPSSTRGEQRPTDHDRENEPRPTSRPRQRIVCHSEPEPFSAYQSSFANLCALKLIIIVSIFACIAEGIHLGMRWIHQRNQDDNAQTCDRSALRLPGAEKRLLAIPTSSVEADSDFSPGAEKKLWAYESARCLVTQSSSGKREFVVYDEEDGDEADRPVI